MSDVKYTSGCVRRLSSRKGKPWQAILKYKDQLGRWKQVTKVLGEATGKKDAERLLRAWQAEMNAEAALSPDAPSKSHRKSKGMLVRDKVAWFLEFQEQKGLVERSTLTVNQFYANKYIYPYDIGGMVFRDVTRADIDSWEIELGRTLKPGTVATAHSLLRKVYSHAIEVGELEVNPFQFVHAPKVQKERINYLDSEGVRRLLYAMGLTLGKGDARRTAFCLALYTGMRGGEICGLRWGDVNFALEKLFVRNAVGRSDGGDYLKQPKNRTSQRDIPMLPELKVALRERKQRVLDEANEGAEDGRKLASVPDKWFVVGEGESFMRPQNLTSSLGRFCRKNGIKGVTGEYVTFHGLRHTFATMAVLSKMDIKSLSSLLGHTNAAMTLNVYASPDAHAKRAGMDMLGEYMRSREEVDDEW